jgi:hypothetical protein
LVNAKLLGRVYSTTLYAYDKFNLTYQEVTLNINAIDP